jgi:hypothetical protein
VASDSTSPGLTRKRQSERRRSVRPLRTPSVNSNEPQEARPQANSKRAATVAVPTASTIFGAKIGRVTNIRLDLIDLDESLYQVRESEANSHARRPQQQYLSARLIDDLAKTVRDTGASLEPIVVHANGAGRFIVVDGHHRYRAYKETLGDTSVVPARVFQGDVGEARLYATIENNKPRLNMTPDERVQAAWVLIALYPKRFDGMTQREIAALLNVSAASVNRMIKKRGELVAVDPACFAENQTGIWREIDRLRFDDDAHERLEERRRKYRERLIAAMHSKFTEEARKFPEDFVLALTEWFDSLNMGTLQYDEKVPDEEAEEEF